MLVRDVVVALDWSDECHGLKVSWPGRTALLLSDHEIDDGNDFYPKNGDAPETELAEAEERMDAISACEVGSMRVKGGYLVVELEHGSVPKFPDGDERLRGCAVPMRWSIDRATGAASPSAMTARPPSPWPMLCRTSCAPAL